MTTALPTLTLYTRVGCHLCEEMKRQLEQFQQQYHFSLNVVDVDADSYLKLNYGERIPVLAAGDCLLKVSYCLSSFCRDCPR